MHRPSECVDVHRIEFEIPWPPDTAYAYFLPTDEPILVDAGSPGADGWNSLESGLDAAGYDPTDVEHLFVTHPHTDHDGQVASLVEAADPNVYTPEGVRERLDRDPEDLASVVRENATAVGVPDVDAAVEEAVESLRRNREFLPPDEIDEDLTDGVSVSAGDVTLRPIHVPGHQVNQAAFLAEGDHFGGSLFAGDALAEPFRPAALHVGFDRGYLECIDAFYEGLDRLAGLEVDRVYPGHGPVFEDAAGAVERDRESLDDLVAECLATLQSLGSATAYEVTEARVDDPRRKGFTVFETVGALARLERQGRIDAAFDGDVREYRA